MASPWFYGPPSRKGLFATEVVALVLVAVPEMVAPMATHHGSALLETIPVPSGMVLALLAVLRRRFPAHIGVLAAAAIGLCVFNTGHQLLQAALTESSVPFTVSIEILALSLLIGACCRRLPAWQAVAIALVGGTAMVTAPLLRYGGGSELALLGVFAAVAWGAALGIGLVLRDADKRQLDELVAVRTSERLRLARELHDLVAHHVTGIVVRAGAARAVANNPRAPEQDPIEVYTAIEQAGADAMSAMRKLVGMLRTDDEAPARNTGFGEAVRDAAGDNADVRMSAELDELTVPPEMATTAHRIVLEALTNARRHAPAATELLVSASLDADHIVLTVDNDNVPRQPAQRSGSGYGLVGMTERVTALGGTVHAGPEPGQRWRVTATLPREPVHVALSPETIR